MRFHHRVHSRHLKPLRPDRRAGYASRDAAKAEAFRSRYGGFASYGDYAAAIADPQVDAVVIAVPPTFHLDLALQALAAGKHVLVEKPAFPRMEDYRDGARRARRGAARRPGRRERSLQAAGGAAAAAARRRRDRRDGVRALHDDRQAAEDRRRLAQRRSDGGRRRVLRGRDPLAARRRQPRPADHHDPRLPAGAVARGARTRAPRACWWHSATTTARWDRCIYSREIPSLFAGLRLSKLFGREGVISFESNGAVMLVRGRGLPRLIFPGFRRHPRLPGDVSRLPPRHRAPARRPR